MNAEKLENDINHLRALCVIHDAEISALYLALSKTMAEHPEILGGDGDFAEFYLKWRSFFARQKIEKLKEDSPQLAAEISEMLNYPWKK